MRQIFVVVVLGLAGCYASEKAGKDIQDTSHDVNQGGIHMDRGALGVRRPPLDPDEPSTTTTTGAPSQRGELERTPKAQPLATQAPPQAPAPAPVQAPMPSATQWPAPPPAPAPAADAGPAEVPGALSM